jgi:hypothetical protein
VEEDDREKGGKRMTGRRKEIWYRAQDQCLKVQSLGQHKTEDLTSPGPSNLLEKDRKKIAVLRSIRTNPRPNRVISHVVLDIL